MTIGEKASQLVQGGMKKKAVFAFFTNTNRGVDDYLGLFDHFHVDPQITWDLFEEWQDS